MSVLGRATVVAALTITCSYDGSAAADGEEGCKNAADCTMEIWDADTTPGRGLGAFNDYPKPYCDPKGEFPTLVSESLGYYLMSDGFTNVVSPEGEIMPDFVDPIGGYGSGMAPEAIHLYVRWHMHCEGPDPDPEIDGDVVDKSIDFWMPLVTVHSIIYQVDLLSMVLDEIRGPDVRFVDTDIEHGWLYVNVDHHVGIDQPKLVSHSASASNPTGSANAWIEAHPVKLTLELPEYTGAEGFAECDLETALAQDCEIKFTHSSSIGDDGWFTGTGTLDWVVRSNSGKYNGLGPFPLASEFQIQVAEAMAVSGE